MTRYVAFLRAINVGGHTLTMERLRRLFVDMKLSEVETYIASGNVIFTSAARTVRPLESRIENHLRRGLGYEVATFIRSTADLVKIVERRPFRDAGLAGNSTLHIAFTGDAPGAAAKRELMKWKTSADDFRVMDREVYWLRLGTMRDSRFSGAVLEKILGMPATLRTSRTVEKIAARYA